MSLCLSCMLEDELRDDKFEIGSNRSMFIIHRIEDIELQLRKEKKKRFLSLSLSPSIYIIIHIIFQKDLFLKTEKVTHVNDIFFEEEFMLSNSHLVLVSCLIFLIRIELNDNNH